MFSFLYHRFTYFPFLVRLDEPQPASVRDVHDSNDVPVEPSLTLYTPELSSVYSTESVL